MILERLKNRTSYLPTPSKHQKCWFPHVITARALEVIKYKAGKLFTFHDDAKSQRKTTTVWISGVESLQENLTMCQPATKGIVLAFLIYFMARLNSLMKEIVPKRDLWSRYGTKSDAVGCKHAANDDERCQSFGLVFSNIWTNHSVISMP